MFKWKFQEGLLCRICWARLDRTTKIFALISTRSGIMYVFIITYQFPFFYLQYYLHLQTVHLKHVSSQTFLTKSMSSTKKGKLALKVKSYCIVFCHSKMKESHKKTKVICFSGLPHKLSVNKANDITLFRTVIHLATCTYHFTVHLIKIQ